MKQGTTARIAAAILAAAALLAGAGALNAQPLPPVDGPPVYYRSQAYYGGRFAGPPVFAPNPAMPPYEVAAILRSRGFLPLSGPVRRGGFYVVSAVHPNGDHGRVVIDAYTGGIARFVPAAEVIGASRNDEMVLVYQGPTFPPPVTAARGVPRPPASVPRVASRMPPSAPLVTPKPRPLAAPQAPETAQAPPVPAPVETKPAAASPPLALKPVEKTPLAPAVQPTRPLPPVQTME